MVSDIRWVPKEERDPLDLGQTERTIVADDDLETRFEPQDTSVGASHEGGVRVKVGCEPDRVWEGA